MTGVRKPTRILALPVFRRNWLYAVEETVEDLKKLPSWRTGRTLVEKARLGQAELLQEVHRRILKQWEDLKAAPAGSIKSRIHRFAQGIVDREDVSETFLKSLPSATDRYDVVYPGNLPERLVRRRLRLFLRQQEYFNRCRLISWSVAAVPLVPLMVAPFPNIPLYYAGYKAYSHNQALKGCRRLLGSIGSAGSVPSGGAGSPAVQAAPASSISSTDSSKQQSEGSRPDAKLQSDSTAGTSSGRTRQPAPVHLISDEELADLVQAQHSASQEPAVDQEAAETIGQRFGFDGLPKLLSRMLKGLQKQS